MITWVSWHQKGKQFWILLQQEMITMPAPHHSVFTGRMSFLPPNQQRQSTEGNSVLCTKLLLIICSLQLKISQLLLQAVIRRYTGSAGSTGK